MGDIIHTLPALTDASKAIPAIEFDWVAEEGFAEIPLWHPAVKRVIPIALRRWRKNFWQTLRQGEIKRFYEELRAKPYDLIIDAQASIKSALISRLVHGKRCGMDKHSVRELFAHIAYQRTYSVERKQHAIKRLRLLFAQILNYTFIDNNPESAITKNKLLPAPVSLPSSYIVFVHNSSWPTKCWPEAYWSQLLQQTTAMGVTVLLPWGNEAEKARAERLASNHPLIKVLPKLKLAEVATILLHAKAAVCSDTGLSHLAAALNVPAITLYGPTNPELIGTIGVSQQHLQANFPCAPCRQEKCTYRKASAQKPACFTTIPPTLVWEQLKNLLAAT